MNHTVHPFDGIAPGRARPGNPTYRLRYWRFWAFWGSFSFSPLSSPACQGSVRQQVTNCDTGGSELSGRSGAHFRFFSPFLPGDANFGINWMVHIESRFRISRRAFDCLHRSPRDLKASEK